MKFSLRRNRICRHINSRTSAPGMVTSHHPDPVSQTGLRRPPPASPICRGTPLKRAVAGTIKNHDAVINLAGASIFWQMTEEQKRAIREIRVNTTRNIVEGIDPTSEKRSPSSTHPLPSILRVPRRRRTHEQEPPGMTSGQACH